MTLTEQLDELEKSWREAQDALLQSDRSSAEYSSLAAAECAARRRMDAFIDTDHLDELESGASRWRLFPRRRH